MGYVGPPRGPLTLHACLEELARLEEGFLLANAGDEWTAGELLLWLQTFHPEWLLLRVVVAFPDAAGEGAIFEVNEEGKVVAGPPLYRMLRQPGAGPFSEGSAGQIVNP